MIDDSARKRNIILASIIAVLVLVTVIVVVVLLFFAKPLGFQYANAQKQAETVSKNQDEVMNATTAYFEALHAGSDAEGPKKQIIEKADQLEKSIKDLKGEGAVQRDEDAKKLHDSYHKKGTQLVKQARDVVATIDKTASLRKACGSEVFDKIGAAESREAGWRVFELCSKAADSFNPNDVPDPDYRIMFISMKKTFMDTKRYLTEDESMYDDVTMQLATLAVTTEYTDNMVRDRIRETVGTSGIGELEALLKKKQES